MIFYEKLAVDLYYLMKQFSSPLGVPNHNYNRRCLIFCNVWEGTYMIKKTLSTFLRSSWERGRVSMIFYDKLAVDLY